MEGFYRLFELFEEITGQSFYDLSVAKTREASQTTDLSSLPSDVADGVREIASRFVEAMDDDFNTGGAIAQLFELRRAINGYINANSMQESATDDQRLALSSAMGLFKELASTLGVFRVAVAKSAGADDALLDGLMQLVIDIRQQARADKNWGVADKIRDALKNLKIVLEDGKQGVRWSRE